MANTKSVVQQDQELPNMELPEGAVVRVHRRKRNIPRAVTFPRVLFAVLVSGLCMALLYNNMYLTSLTKRRSGKNKPIWKTCKANMFHSNRGRNRR